MVGLRGGRTRRAAARAPSAYPPDASQPLPPSPSGVFCDLVYPAPYADCMSGYTPVNTPYALINVR